MKNYYLENSHIIVKLLTFICIISLVYSCATFRSDLEGKYESSVTENLGSDKVSAFFLITFLKKTHGLDAIPKIKNKRRIIHDFDDIFREALREISNIKNYSTFTESSDDVNHPKRRAKKDTLKLTHDYTIRITVLQEKTFAKYFLAGFFSTVSLTTLPLSYSWKYSMEVDVLDKRGTLIQNYHRSAKIKKWVQTLLLFIYPFHPEERKKEEIFIEFLSDVFRQIESERILK